MVKALKKVDVYKLWKRVSIVYFILFLITIFVLPVFKGEYVPYEPYLLFLYQYFGFLFYAEYLGQFLLGFFILFTNIFLVLLSSFINFIFSVIVNKRSLLLAKVFTPIQICGNILNILVLYTDFGLLIGLSSGDKYSINFLIATLILLLLSVIQLFLVFKLKLKQQEETDKKALNTSLIFAVLTFCIVEIFWIFFFLPIALCIILLVSVGINFIFRQDKILLKSLGIWQAFGLGISVLFLLSNFSNGVMLDIPIWYIVIGIIAFAFALAYLIIAFSDKIIKEANYDLLLRILSVASLLLVIVPNAVIIKDISNLILALNCYTEKIIIIMLILNIVYYIFCILTVVLKKRFIHLLFFGLMFVFSLCYLIGSLVLMADIIFDSPAPAYILVYAYIYECAISCLFIFILLGFATSSLRKKKSKVLSTK